MKNLRIISLPVDDGGCGWYRVRQPFQMIKLNTMHDAYLIDRTKLDTVDIGKALAMSDICIMRQGAEEGAHKLRFEPDFRHLKWVLDIDDNLELISPYSEHYKENGVQNFKDIWVDGKTKGFSIPHNKQRIINLMSGLMMADMVTVTTERLAEYVRQYNSNVVVLPNSVDIDEWWPLLDKRYDKKPNELRIGWSGGVSHYEDWYTIKKPLNELLRKYKFKLVVVGSHFTGIIDENLRSQVEIHPWVPFPAHSYHMMAMQLDAAIIPLTNLPFNHYKSSIKFHEFSAMAVPSLVSRSLPYTQDITHGKNGLLYSNDEEFKSNLELLITSGNLRETLGSAALTNVKENYNAARNAHLWTDAYSSLLT